MIKIIVNIAATIKPDLVDESVDELSAELVDDSVDELSAEFMSMNDDSVDELFEQGKNRT